ncbi:MAG: hypothetical protein ACI4GD_00140, partial [Lachnospiraceae bacterium]
PRIGMRQIYLRIRVAPRVYSSLTIIVRDFFYLIGNFVEISLSCLIENCDAISLSGAKKFLTECKGVLICKEI